MKKYKSTLIIFLIVVLMATNIYIYFRYAKYSSREITELKTTVDKYEKENNRLDEVLDTYLNSDFLNECELIHIKFRIFLNKYLDEFTKLCELEYSNYINQKSLGNEYSIPEIGEYGNIRKILFDDYSCFSNITITEESDGNIIIFAIIKNPYGLASDVKFRIIYKSGKNTEIPPYDWVKQINDNVYFCVMSPPPDYDIDDIDNKILSLLNENN